MADAKGEKRLKILEELVDFYVEKDPQKAVQYGQEALILAEKFPVSRQQMTLLNRLSTAYSRLGDFKPAEDYANKAIHIAEKIRHKIGEAEGWLNLGEVNKNYGEYQRAIDYLEKARNLYQETNHKKGLGTYFSNISYLYMRIGDYSSALDYALKAHEIFEEIGDYNGLALATKNIGLSYFFMKEWEKAQQYLARALEYYERGGDQWGIAVVLTNIGYNYIQSGNHEKALKYLNRSLQIARQKGFKYISDICLGNIGLVYAARNNHSLALEYYAQSLKMSKAANSQTGTAYTLIQISQSLKAQGKYKEALSHLTQALAIATRINLKERVMEAYRNLSDIYNILGNIPGASRCFQKYKEMSEAIFNEQTRIKIVKLQNKYDTEKKEKEIALLKKEKVIQNLSLERQRNLTNFLVIISALVLGFAFVIYYLYRLKTKTNRSLVKETEEHKLTSQKLRESEEKFRVLAEKSMVGIFIFRDNAIQYANPRFLAIFGYGAEEIIGQPLRPLIFDQDRSLVDQKLSPDQLDGSGLNAHNFQFRGLTKDGEVIHLDCYGACTHYQGKLAVLETVIDITDRERAHAELFKSQKLESIGILAGGIAHDFNNLLTIIIGYLSMAKEESSENPDIYKMLEGAEKALNQSVELVNKLIGLSRSGWFINEKLKLPKILNETRDYYPDLNSFNYSLSIPPDLYPLRGDTRQLRQVFYNLLKNADESAVGSKPVLITAQNIFLRSDNIFTLMPGNYVKISIIDNGKGIPKDYLGNIFDPYFSTKNTYSRKGMGLGLAICYSIIKKHNGCIDIQSEAGRGTTVVVYLPAYEDTSSESDPQ